jgi:peptidoglycan hydrolase-like protein with peptidoglycan-binding domain
MENVKRRSGPLLVGAGIFLVVAVSGVGALGLGGDGGDEGGAAGLPRTGRTVAVSRATLTDQAELEGALGHGPEVPFLVKAAGTVTWLPENGAEVKRGETVLRVDDRPVVLLYGALPVYRDLRTTPPVLPTCAGGGQGGGTGADESTDGAQAGGAEGAPTTVPVSTPLRGMDVKQFETNLAALGYTGFTVDDTYSDRTAQAVKDWQKDLGLPQTGRVAAGDIVYAPGAVRIAGASVRVGAEAAGSPVSYTGTKRMVTISASAAETEWAARGTEVTVELPAGRKVRGRVSTVGKEAVAAPGAAEGGEGKTDAKVTVTITFADRTKLGRIQSGPVVVRYAKSKRKDVLTVPVAALVALAEGGYGLEVAKGDSFIAVKTGLFADGSVEVGGPGVREGLKVRIPE